MSGGLYVLRRELRALVTSPPRPYAIAAAYLILSGIFFINILITSQIPDLEHYYSNVANALLVLVPVVAMRSFAEGAHRRARHHRWPGGCCGRASSSASFRPPPSTCGPVDRRVALLPPGRTPGPHPDGPHRPRVHRPTTSWPWPSSALALMISARAASPASAACLGFGSCSSSGSSTTPRGGSATGWRPSARRSIRPVSPGGSSSGTTSPTSPFTTLIGLGLAVAALERDRPGRKLELAGPAGGGGGRGVVLCGGAVALAGKEFEKGSVIYTEHTARAPPA